MPKPKQLIRDSFEIIKDSASQIGRAVSPAEMVKQATGVKEEKKESQQPEESDFTKYLKEELGNKKLSEEELEKVRQKAREHDQKEIEKWETIVRRERTITPAHMRLPPRPPEKRAYEEAWEGIERKEAEKEHLEKQEEFVEPKGQKRQPGLKRAVRRKASPEGWGGKMDSKIG